MVIYIYKYSIYVFVNILAYLHSHMHGSFKCLDIKIIRNSRTELLLTLCTHTLQHVSIAHALMCYFMFGHDTYIYIYIIYIYSIYKQSLADKHTQIISST